MRTRSGQSYEPLSCYKCKKYYAYTKFNNLCSKCCLEKYPNKVRASPQAAWYEPTLSANKLIPTVPRPITMSALEVEKVYNFSGLLRLGFRKFSVKLSFSSLRLATCSKVPWISDVILSFSSSIFAFCNL